MTAAKGSASQAYSHGHIQPRSPPSVITPKAQEGMAHQAAYAQQDGVGLDEGCDRTLTLREGQIARLVAIGSTDKEIARELDISPLTVATHLRHIYRKFDVHKRGAMVAMLMRVGQLMILLGSTLNVGDEDLQALVQSVIGPAIASIS